MSPIRIQILRPGVREEFPPPERALEDPNGLLAAGGDLSPERLLDAYRHAIFPWFSEGTPILWWCPEPRTVFETDRPHVSRRLRRWLRQCDWTIRVDSAFAEVVHACAAPRADQDGTWITQHMFEAYCELHALGHAHSIEAFDTGQRLVGGLYGVALGRMFFAESMFSRASNGSKVALLGLCRLLRDWGFPLCDAQVASPHLARMGAKQMPRAAFVEHVRTHCAMPAPAWHDVVPGKVCELV